MSDFSKRIIIAISVIAILAASAFLIVSSTVAQRKYNEAYDFFNSGSYVEAAEKFEALKDYRSSITMALESKYQYVKSPDNYNKNNPTTYKFLRQLAQVGYRDSKSIFSSFYDWKLDVCAINNDPDDKETTMSTFSKYDTLYFHFRLSGGPPDGETKIYMRYVSPDGKPSEYASGKVYSDGSSVWYSWYYTDPSYGDTGTLTAQFYDDSGHLLGEYEVYITY